MLLVLVLLLLLVLLSVNGGRFISNVKGPHQKSTSTKSNISTKSNSYNYNIEPNVLGLLCNRLLSNDHSTHSMQLGEFILPYDLKTTIERLIIMKDNDPYIKATTQIGDNINSVTSWSKQDIDNTSNQKKLYSREINYVHNRKTSSIFAPKSTSHNLLQILSLNSLDNDHVNHAMLLGFMNLSHVPFCHNTHYTTLWDFSSFRGRADTNLHSMTRVKVTLDIEGLPPSIYQSIIKNEINKDLKAFVQEFHSCSLKQIQKPATLNNLSNDEKDLLASIMKTTKSHSIKEDNDIQQMSINNLNDNFWILPSNDNIDYDIPYHKRAIETFLLSFLIICRKYYSKQVKGIIFDKLTLFPYSNIISKFGTVLASYKIINNRNIFTKIRKIF